MTFDEFYTKTIGKAIDFDKAAGVQCVDLVDLYFKEVIEMPVVYVSGAKEFYTKFDSYSLLRENFNKIPNTRELIAQKGDIVIWGGGSWGHCAIATGEGDKDIFWSIEENTLGRHEPTTLIKHTYNNRYGVDCAYPVLGVLRPKEQYKVLGFAWFQVADPSGLNIREGANGAKIICTMPKDTIFAVTEYKAVNGLTWGRVFNGNGWSCLTGYTRKIAR